MLFLENIFFFKRNFAVLRVDKNRKARSSHFGLNKELPQAAGSSKRIIYLIHSPVVCKTGDLPILLLLQIRCSWCHLIFYLCRPCWRGHRYCSDPCRLAAKRKQRREAQRIYRQTPQGKKAHCYAENRRRDRLRKKNQRNMDDATTTRLPAWCMRLLLATGKRILPLQTTTCCHFCGSCGQIVDEFPRRGYG